MENKRLRLSQCMIVKDEEENIRQALSWAKDIAYEQIVVDTGSTDRTVELAEAMGAKIWYFPWIDDFAAAKNFAISKASGDWVAFLDADEYLPEEWGNQLLPMLESLDGDAACYAMRSPLLCVEGGKVTSAARHCRFFRRMEGLEYQNPIHEHLALNGEALPDAHITDVGEKFPVYHTGYAPEIMEAKKKTERNIRILKKELERAPGDYSIMGYLGDSCYRQDGDNALSIQWYQKAIAAMPDTLSERDERSASTFINLMYLLAHQMEIDEAELVRVYERAIHTVPWVYDADYIVGSYYVQTGQYKKAALHLERGLQVAEQYGSATYGLYMMTDLAVVWDRLAICYYENRDLAACVRCCVALLKTDNRRITSLKVLLKALSGEKPEAILGFLKNIYDMNQSSDRIFVLKGAILAEAGGLLECMKGECTEEELAYLEFVDQNTEE